MAIMFNQCSPKYTWLGLAWFIVLCFQASYYVISHNLASPGEKLEHAPLHFATGHCPKMVRHGFLSRILQNTIPKNHATPQVHPTPYFSICQLSWYFPNERDVISSENNSVSLNDMNTGLWPKPQAKKKTRIYFVACPYDFFSHLP